LCRNIFQQGVPTYANTTIFGGIMSKILVLEDSEDSFRLIKSALERDHVLSWVTTLSEAQAKINGDYDLVIVDIELPDGDGFQFCDWMRSQKDLLYMPLIFLTAKNTIESRITGYSVGGDDYISKPFNLLELKARVDAKLKRSARYTNSIVKSSGIEIDLRSQAAHIVENEKVTNLDLTPIEFKILYLFVSEQNKAFSRDEILNRIWGDEIYVYPRSVDTHVSKLRAKLGPKSMLIKSIHAYGYKYTPEKAGSEREWTASELR
jgi:DNA-binding response OmpR family regulator